MSSPRNSFIDLPPLTRPDGSPIRALVVDDEASLTELVTMGLRMAGWDVAVAHDGAEAMRAARNYRPDVLVLDVMMPQVDGIAALTRIRQFTPRSRPCSSRHVTAWMTESPGWPAAAMTT